MVKVVVVMVVVVVVVVTDWEAGFDQRKIRTVVKARENALGSDGGGGGGDDGGDGGD